MAKGYLAPEFVDKRILTSIATWSALYQERDFWVEGVMAGAARMLGGAVSTTLMLRTLGYTARLVSTAAAGALTQKSVTKFQSKAIPMAILAALSGSGLHKANKWSGFAYSLRAFLAANVVGDELAGFDRGSSETPTLGEFVATLVLAPELSEAPGMVYYVSTAVWDVLRPQLVHSLGAYEGWPSNDDPRWPEAWAEATAIAWDTPLPWSPWAPGVAKRLRSADRVIVRTGADDVAVRLSRFAFLQGCLCPIATGVSLRLAGLLGAAGLAVDALNVVTTDPSTGDFYDTEKIIRMVDFVIDKNLGFAEFLKHHTDAIHKFIRLIATDEVADSLIQQA